MITRKKIMQLLLRTKCYLRPRSETHYEVRFNNWIREKTICCFHLLKVCPYFGTAAALKSQTLTFKAKMLTKLNLICSTRNFCYFWKIFCYGFGELPGSGFLLYPVFYNGLSSVSKRIHGFMGLWVERVQITLTRRTHDRSLLLYSMRRTGRQWRG